jgi:copper chaperone CopZ
MKTFVVLSLGLSFALALQAAPLMACEGEAQASTSATAHGGPALTLTESGPQRAVFQVNGISCKSCEKKVRAALRKVPGVKSVAFLKAGSKNGIRIAQVTFEQGHTVTPESLAKAVEGAGFKATLTQ